MAATVLRQSVGAHRALGLAAVLLIIISLVPTPSCLAATVAMGDAGARASGGDTWTRVEVLCLGAVCASVVVTAVYWPRRVGGAWPKSQYQRDTETVKLLLSMALNCAAWAAGQFGLHLHHRWRAHRGGIGGGKDLLDLASYPQWSAVNFIICAACLAANTAKYFRRTA